MIRSIDQESHALTDIPLHLLHPCCSQGKLQDNLFVLVEKYKVWWWGGW